MSSVAVRPQLRDPSPETPAQVGLPIYQRREEERRLPPLPLPFFPGSDQVDGTPPIYIKVKASVSHSAWTTMTAHRLRPLIR